MKTMNNYNSGLSGDEDGEMGIGMMIIFIAMVLVAAVAAAVIINTANDVREQAQSTGAQAIADVATGFNVQNVIGDRSDRNDSDPADQATIQYVEVRVQLHAGSPDIAMGDVLVEITDGNTLFTASFGSTLADTTFTAEALIDDDSSFVATTNDTDYVVTQGDVIKLTLDTTGLNLAVNTNVHFRIIPRVGADTYEAFTTPDTYLDRYVQLIG